MISAYIINSIYKWKTSIHSFLQKMANLIENFCELLKCKPTELSDALNHPINIEKVNNFLSNCKNIETTYRDKDNALKLLVFEALAKENSANQNAYNGYLRISVQQHYYIRHRIRLLHPSIKCVAARAIGTNRALGYYPPELLRIKEEGEEDDEFLTPRYINEWDAWKPPSMDGWTPNINYPW